ncbi:MAG: hypothetical protein DRJ10_14980, partial [Bacteroidetes bacterium]
KSKLYTQRLDKISKIKANLVEFNNNHKSAIKGLVQLAYKIKSCKDIQCVESIKFFNQKCVN